MIAIAKMILEIPQPACSSDLLTLNSPKPVVVEIRDLCTNGVELITEADDNILLTEHFAKLRYVDVMLSTDSNKARVSCLCDGGAEMCVIRSNIEQGWELSFIGTVKLRGLFGASVLAKLAMINMKLCTDHTGDVIEDCDNSLPMLCAICDEMHDDVISLLIAWIS
jgi:hypothetical protein